MNVSKISKIVFFFLEEFSIVAQQDKDIYIFDFGRCRKKCPLNSLYHFMFSLIGVSSSICSLTVIIIFLDSQYDRQNFSMNSFFQLLFIFFPKQSFNFEHPAVDKWWCTRKGTFNFTLRNFSIERA